MQNINKLVSTNQLGRFSYYHTFLFRCVLLFFVILFLHDF